MRTHVPGWAFAGPEARQESLDAFNDALDKLGLPRLETNEKGYLVLSDETLKALRDLMLEHRHGYNNFSVRLDPAKTKDMTAQQLVLLADQGNGCFGGRIEGPWTVVYTD